MRKVLKQFEIACLKHLQGQHNQKRHGYRYGSVDAARRSMRGMTNASERAEYRKRAGMPTPTKREKVEEKIDIAGFTKGGDDSEPTYTMTIPSAWHVSGGGTKSFVDVSVKVFDRRQSGDNFVITRKVNGARNGEEKAKTLDAAISTARRMAKENPLPNYLEDVDAYTKSVVSKIRSHGKSMVSKYAGQDFYGKPFSKGAKIIYSQYGIVLDE